MFLIRNSHPLAAETVDSHSLPAAPRRRRSSAAWKMRGTVLEASSKPQTTAQPTAAEPLSAFVAVISGWKFNPRPSPWLLPRKRDGKLIGIVALIPIRRAPAPKSSRQFLDKGKSPGRREELFTKHRIQLPELLFQILQGELGIIGKVGAIGL